jgi:hypothetical protein
MGRDVNPEIRKAYVRQLAKVIAADGQVDANELVKLYEVCALLGVPDAERLQLVVTLAFDIATLDGEPVPRAILEDEELRMALAKDVLFFDEEDEDHATRRVANSILNLIKLTPEQTKVLSDWVHLENQILRKMGAGEESMAPSDASEITARATAVGVPLTALYFAGITGFSAVGLTSGLAAIGGYTGLAALGLNPMTAGIAGLILGGIAVKKLADYALGNNNQAADGLRERINVIRDVHLKAATAIAGDIPRFEVVPANDPARAASVLASMRLALSRMEALRE